MHTEELSVSKFSREIVLHTVSSDRRDLGGGVVESRTDKDQ